MSLEIRYKKSTQFFLEHNILQPVKCVKYQFSPLFWELLALRQNRSSNYKHIYLKKLFNSQVVIGQYPHGVSWCNDTPCPLMANFFYLRTFVRSPPSLTKPSGNHIQGFVHFSRICSNISIFSWHFWKVTESLK